MLRKGREYIILGEYPLSFNILSLNFKAKPNAAKVLPEPVGAERENICSFSMSTLLT